MDEIIECEVGNSKIAILRCSEDTPYPKYHMDSYMMKYVGEKSFNYFVAKELNNPYVRIVIGGINELEWIKIKDFKSLLAFSAVNTNIEFILFFYPTFENNPTMFLDDLADKCLKNDSSFRQFIDSHFDNPFFRLLIRNFGKLNYSEYHNQHL